MPRLLCSGCVSHETSGLSLAPSSITPSPSFLLLKKVSKDVGERGKYGENLGWLLIYVLKIKSLLSTLLVIPQRGLLTNPCWLTLYVVASGSVTGAGASLHHLGLTTDSGGFFVSPLPPRALPDHPPGLNLRVVGKRKQDPGWGRLFLRFGFA